MSIRWDGVLVTVVCGGTAWALLWFLHGVGAPKEPRAPRAPAYVNVRWLWGLYSCVVGEKLLSESWLWGAFLRQTHLAVPTRVAVLPALPPVGRGTLPHGLPAPAPTTVPGPGRTSGWNPDDGL